MATSQVQTPPQRPISRIGRPRKTQAPLDGVAAAFRELDEEDQVGTGASDTPTEEPAGMPRVFRGSSGEDFFDWLTGFSSDEWQFLMAYLYRTAPMIDRRASGKATNIRRYGSFFDQDMIMHDEGSGGYRIDLTRKDPASGKSQRIGQVYINILNMDYPPRVPAGDWVDQPENDVWKWAKPAIERATATGQFTHIEQTDPNKIFDTILAGVERLRGNNGNDKADSIAAATINQLGGMVTALMARPAPAPDNSATTQIITFLQTELSETRKEIRAMREAQRSEQPKGLLEQVKELVPVVTQVTDLLGLKGRAAKAAETNWGDVVTEVVDKLSENAPILYDIWRGTKNGDGSPAAGGFRLPAATAPKKDEPSPAASNPEPKQQEDNLPDDKRARYQAILGKWGKLIEGVAPFLMDNFRRNKTGYDFRDWFIEAQGMNNYAQFRLEVSAQELTELTQLHSFLKTIMQPADKVNLFFTEFLTEPGNEPPGVVVPDGE